MHASGQTPAAIARALKRDVSTIRRELQRNTRGNWYCAVDAQKLAQKRRQQAKRQCHKMDRPEIRAYVFEKLQLYWSPDQIAGRLKREFPNDPRRRVSHQTIYAFVRDPQHKKTWAPYLRGTRPRGRKPIFAGKTGIANRPEIINRRERLGDWEGDTILGKKRRSDGALVSLVERKTGLLELWKVANRQSMTVIDGIAKRLQRHPPELRQSCTFDHGPEFTLHARLQKQLGLATYFAQPHCPWQRGTNENTNGLVRQFIPKGKSLRDLTTSEVARVQDLINGRPRKRHGYATPTEMLSTPCCRAIQT
jgi:IS30 family transposase